jgi:elongation factor P hydroxylase
VETPCLLLGGLALITRQLATALQAQGHRVSHQLVSELLRSTGYSLQANTKTLEGKQHPDRDAQFQYLSEQSKAFLKQGLPVISMDAKKKELVGEFKKKCGTRMATPETTC